MLRLILAISLIILSIAGSIYVWQRSSNEVVQARPEISDTKKAAIARRAEQQANDAAQDAKDEESVLKLEQTIK